MRFRNSTMSRKLLAGERCDAMKKKAATTHDESPPPKTYRRDFVDDALGSVAAGFMMASAWSRWAGLFERSATWKRSLLTVSIRESGRIEVTGQWIEFLKRRFREGEAIGIRLVDRLFGGTVTGGEPFSGRVDYYRDGSISAANPREYDYRSPFPSRDFIPPKDFRTKTDAATDKLWGARRLCICPSRRYEQAAKHKFCSQCGGSLIPLTFHCDACHLEWSMEVGKLNNGKLYCPTCYGLLTPVKE